MRDQKLRILLVDSDVKAGGELATFLRTKCSYDVDTAVTYEQALRLVEGTQWPYEISLIDDCIAPRESDASSPLSLHLMQQIQKKYPQTAAILFRDAEFSVSLEKVLKAGASFYLPKDVDYDTLGVLIRKSIDDHRQKQEWAILDHMRRTVDKLAKMDDLQEVLRFIAEDARQLFQATSASILTYDASRARFTRNASFTVGIPQDICRPIWKRESEWLPMEQHIIKQGWVGVKDIDDPTWDKLIPQMYRNYLSKIDIKSFQGITLFAEHKPLAVLYVNYHETQHFSEEAEFTAKTFAQHVASALRKANLLYQLRKTQVAARAVAEMSVLEKLDETLRFVAEVTRNILGCDAVALYPYDPIQNTISANPTMLGVWNESKARRFVKVREDGIIAKILNLDNIYCVVDTETDPFFSLSRFTREERIASCIGIPLKFNNERVGVMFVNYRTRHHFSTEEIAKTKLFARQATVAIRNSQLYEQREKKLRQSEMLARLSNELRSAASVQEVLDRSAKTAREMLEADFASIILRDRDGTLRIRAVVNWNNDYIGYQLNDEVGHQTIYTIESTEAVVVEDYDKEDRFLKPFIAKHYGAKSGVSVPMIRNGDAVGVIILHTQQLRRFSDEETDLLWVIGNHAALAVQNVVQYQALERQQAYISALYEASRAITEGIGLERDQLLDHIVKIAVESIRDEKGSKALFATMNLYDEDTKKLQSVSLYKNPNKDCNPKINKKTFLAR